MPPKKDIISEKQRTLRSNTQNDVNSPSSNAKEQIVSRQGTLTDFVVKTPARKNDINAVGPTPVITPVNNKHNGLAEKVMVHHGENTCSLIGDSILLNGYISPSASLCSSPKTNNPSNEHTNTSMLNTVGSPSPSIIIMDKSSIESTVVEAAVEESPEQHFQRIISNTMAEPLSAIAKSLETLTSVISKLNTSVGSAFQHLTEITLDSQTINTKQDDLTKKLLLEEKDQLHTISTDIKKALSEQVAIQDTIKHTLKISQRIASKTQCNDESKKNVYTSCSLDDSAPLQEIILVNDAPSTSKTSLASSQEIMTIPSLSKTIPALFNFQGMKKTAGFDSRKQGDIGEEVKHKKRKLTDNAHTQQFERVNWQNMVRDAKKSKKTVVEKKKNKSIPPSIPSRRESLCTNMKVANSNKRTRETCSNVLYMTPLFRDIQNSNQEIYLNRQAILMMCSKNPILSHIGTAHIQSVSFMQTAHYRSDTTVATFIDHHISTLIWENAEYFLRHGIDVQHVLTTHRSREPHYDSPESISELSSRPLPPLPTDSIEDTDYEETTYEELDSFDCD